MDNVLAHTATTIDLGRFLALMWVVLVILWLTIRVIEHVSHWWMTR